MRLSCGVAPAARIAPAPRRSRTTSTAAPRPRTNATSRLIAFLHEVSIASDRSADRQLRRPLWLCPSSLPLFLRLRRRALLPVARATVSHHVAVMLHHVTHLLHHLAHLLHHALHPLVASLHHAAASRHATMIALHHPTLTHHAAHHVALFVLHHAATHHAAATTFHHSAHHPTRIAFHHAAFGVDRRRGQNRRDNNGSRHQQRCEFTHESLSFLRPIELVSPAATAFQSLRHDNSLSRRLDPSWRRQKLQTRLWRRSHHAVPSIAVYRNGPSCRCPMRT